MRHFSELIREAKEIYEKNKEVRDQCISAAIVEASGYMKWPRLKEILEYAKRLGIRKIGIAFCIGLAKEAYYVYQVFKNNNFEVYSVCCKVGGINKLEIGIPKDYLLEPEFEAICNPVGQALILNKLSTELNIAVGLCVGHDSIFYRYSKAPVVTLIAKDRVTGHNPAVVLYTGYYREKFGIKP